MLEGKRKFIVAGLVLLLSALLRIADKLTGAELVSIWTLNITAYMGANALQAVGVAFSSKGSS